MIKLADRGWLHKRPDGVLSYAGDRAGGGIWQAVASWPSAAVEFDVKKNNGSAEGSDSRVCTVNRSGFSAAPL
ncbi:hypothetical protein [Streptomyces sp. NPDC047718]|uniref:hypothetical protein n=1 Tax=Streptomyces sp. NPDC047718 TaxID=3155479 RepID=UPI0033C25491